MSILTDISENLQKGKAKVVKELVQQAIDQGIPVEQILDEGLLSGMNVVGEKFKNNEVFVPEGAGGRPGHEHGRPAVEAPAGRGRRQGLRQGCASAPSRATSTTSAKTWVKMMMEGKGLEVIDLGTDVSPETFVKTAIEQDCQIICCLRPAHHHHGRHGRGGQAGRGRRHPGQG